MLSEEFAGVTKDQRWTEGKPVKGNYFKIYILSLSPSPSPRPTPSTHNTHCALVVWYSTDFSSEDMDR